MNKTAAKRLAWAAARAAGPKRRAWTADEVAALERLVGRRTPREMAARLGRGLNSILSKTMQLGYRTKADLVEPIGLTASAVARRVGRDTQGVWRDVQSGVLPARKKDKKEYLIRWPAVRAYEKAMARRLRRRQQALARIGEPHISKQTFMRLLGISETHAHRYLQGGVVRCWKVPCRWVDAPRSRWEWRVSARDARRVYRQRAAGVLRLRQKRYRAIADRDNGLVQAKRKAGLLGRGGPHGRRACPVPGQWSPGQAADALGRDYGTIMAWIRAGRLAAKKVRVGRRIFLTVAPRDARACDRAARRWRRA